MRLKIVVKTTNKHACRISCCLESWLQGLDYVCITDKPTGLFEEIPCGDSEDYDSAEEKVCTFFGMVREGLFSEYDWLMILDDDAILDQLRLSAALPSLSRGMIHGHDMKRAWSEDLSLSFPSGGGGYLVPPELLRSLPPMKKMGIGLEDVRVGFWMREHRVPLGTSLALGPWFPLGERYWDFERAERESPEDVEDMVRNLPESDKSFIRSKITHHYVRGKNTMRLMYELMIS